jgi:hypothetical protein
MSPWTRERRTSGSSWIADVEDVVVAMESDSGPPMAVGRVKVYVLLFSCGVRSIGCFLGGQLRTSSLSRRMYLISTPKLYEIILEQPPPPPQARNSLLQGSYSSERCICRVKCGMLQQRASLVLQDHPSLAHAYTIPSCRPENLQLQPINPPRSRWPDPGNYKAVASVPRNRETSDADASKYSTQLKRYLIPLHAHERAPCIGRAPGYEKCLAARGQGSHEDASVSRCTPIRRRKGGSANIE